MSNNPWDGMPPNNQRRVDQLTERNLFWMTDFEGSYGFYIHASTPFSTEATKIPLKGITIAKRTSETGSDFFLVLSRNEDWPVFSSLCCDLISAAVQYSTEEAMIAAVEGRLFKWQRLLKSATRPLSIESQMGLFAELLFLRDILAKQSGISTAILQWRGPESDKQDFVCDSSTAEVKSYSSSKGPTVLISSLQQLHSDKTKFYLIAYGLSISSSGLTIGDLAEQIFDLFDGDDNARNLFEAKLEQYGYIPDIPQSDLEKFVSDVVRAYKVLEDFPRLSPSKVAPEITTVKYSIDLGRCSTFEVPIESIEVGI